MIELKQGKSRVGTAPAHDNSRFARAVERRFSMNSQITGVLARAALYSFLAGVAAGIIYIVITFLTGGKLSSEAISVGLITAAISFVIALVFFTSFMLYFSRKKAS
jgi:ABC-type multidrug transport system permease subunit